MWILAYIIPIGIVLLIAFIFLAFYFSKKQRERFYAYIDYLIKLSLDRINYKIDNPSFLNNYNEIVDEVKLLIVDNRSGGYEIKPSFERRTEQAMKRLDKILKDNVNYTNFNNKDFSTNITSTNECAVDWKPKNKKDRLIR